jgi:hypothetical protein
MTPTTSDRFVWQHERPPTCLVVDDTHDMRKLTVNTLTQLGFLDVHEARNGAEAMRWLAHRRADIILSDSSMPVMDGLALLKAVRQDTQHHSTPFILITAEAEGALIRKAIDYGVSSLLLKPYSQRLLLEHLRKALVAKPRRLPEGLPDDAAPQAAALRDSRPRVLVVDDDPVSSEILIRVLAQDYRVTRASHGESALALCQTEDKPDLVLMDVLMPGIDGFEVARRLREHPMSSGIPIIFVTSLDSHEERVKGLGLGAVDFISKPIRPSLLQPRVRNLMRYIEQRKIIQQGYDALVANAQQRDEAERIIRHELTGPLDSAIDMLSEIIDDACEHERPLKQIRATLQLAMRKLRLSTVVHQIEAQTYVAPAEPVPIVEVIQQALLMHRPQMERKQIGIRFEHPQTAATPPLHVMGDTDLCRSLFESLLKNAWEAAPAGSTVDIHLSDGPTIQVSIRNCGCVPAPMRQRFFAKFATFGKEAGSGLGTYTAKLFTQAMRGSIEMQTSDLDDSTTLTVRLPRNR